MENNFTSCNLTSWSISKLQIYEQCPYRAKLAWVDKIPDTQPHPQMERGTQIHLEAENFITKNHYPLAHELRHFEPELKAVKNKNFVCEQEWGFDKDWKPTEWNKAWLRAKLDILVELTPHRALAVDIKSGGRFGNELKHAVQLQLYATITMIRIPQIDEVVCELWYVDKNELADFTMKRSQLETHLTYFDRKARAMCEDTQFIPRPNVVSCKYCPYHADRQGDCPHGYNPNNPIPIPKGYVPDPTLAELAKEYS